MKVNFNFKNIYIIAATTCVKIDIFSNHTVESSVQQHAAEWTLFNALAYLVPAIFADIILGFITISLKVKL